MILTGVGPDLYVRRHRSECVSTIPFLAPPNVIRKDVADEHDRLDILVCTYRVRSPDIPSRFRHILATDICTEYVLCITVSRLQNQPGVGGGNREI